MSHLTGAGTVVGVIDDGCDFAHQNFRTSAGESRLLFLWDQTGERQAQSPPDYGYGREVSRASLDAALQTATPYAHLSYSPAQAAHGTHVLDIAAGNGRGTGIPGVAPGADLIFVQLGKPDYGERESLGNSRRLLEAVEYIFRRAETAGACAAIVNLSLTMHGGPHDGTTLVDKALAELLLQPRRAIVVAAGNAGDGSTHASGRVSAGGVRTLSWDVHSADDTDNEMEIWYTGEAPLRATLRSPGGTHALLVPVNESPRLRIGGKVVATAASERSDPSNGAHQINLFIRKTAPRGRWTLDLESSDEATISFHAWIERDDFLRKLQQSRFAPGDRDPSCTLGTLSCANSAIVVAAHNPDRFNKPVCEFSSRGPTRTGGQKPDLSAPGFAIRGATACAGGTHELSGTSQAAPHVTGALALLCEASAEQMSAPAMRVALLAGVDRNPTGWQSDTGEGRLNVSSAVRLLTTQQPHGGARG